jgi:hypothetical protein
VRELAEVSPQTATVLMTGGVISPADVPSGVPILRKPFTRQDLLSAVQATLERSAQARTELRREMDKSAEQRKV